MATISSCRIRPANRLPRKGARRCPDQAVPCQSRPCRRMRLTIETRERAAPLGIPSARRKGGPPDRTLQGRLDSEAARHLRQPGTCARSVRRGRSRTGCRGVGRMPEAWLPAAYVAPPGRCAPCAGRWCAGRGRDRPGPRIDVAFPVYRGARPFFPALIPCPAGRLARQPPILRRDALRPSLSGSRQGACAGSRGRTGKTPPGNPFMMRIKDRGCHSC